MHLSPEALAQIAKIAQENHSRFEKVTVKTGSILKKLRNSEGWSLLCHSGTNNLHFEQFKLILALHQADEEGRVTLPDGDTYTINWRDETQTRSGWVADVTWPTESPAMWPNPHGAINFRPSGSDDEGYQINPEETQAFLMTLGEADRVLLEDLIKETAKK